MADTGCVDIDTEQAKRLLGAHLRGLRGKKGLSREELFELSGVPVISIRRFESGERTPDAIVLLALCGALGVTLGSFADGFQRELEEMSKPDAGQ